MLSKVADHFPLLAMTVALCLLLPTSRAHSQTLTGSANQMSNRSLVRGSFLAEYAKYPSSLANNPKLDQSQLIQSNLAAYYRAPFWYSGIDLMAGHYLDWQYSHFAVRELKTSYLSPAGWNASLGRHKHLWSQVDRDWNLGVWQPIFNEDALRPIEQGLSGFFVNLQPWRTQLTLFVTPIFVPTMGPEVRESNRNLVADSRWYRSPASSTDLFGQNVRVLYSLEDSDINKLVNNQGAALHWRLGHPQHWFSAAIAYKPINKITLKYKRDFSLSQLSGDAIVGPAVTYHRLLSLDYFASLPAGMTSSFSYIQDDPEPKLPTRDTNSSRIEWIQQQPGKIRVLAASIKQEWSEDWAGRLDLLYADEDPTKDLDANGIERGHLFPYRLNFSRATKFSILHQYPWGIQQSLKSQLSWLRDFEQRGEIIQAQVALVSLGGWGARLGFDILAVDDSTSENQDPRFINEFRANDRFFGGVDYEF